MAARGDLAHNPGYREAHARAGARMGENVAYARHPGMDLHDLAAFIHQNLLASPAHRANLLDPGWVTIGIGVVVDGDGRMWVTQDFADVPAPTADPAGRHAPGHFVRPA